MSKRSISSCDQFEYDIFDSCAPSSEEAEDIKIEADSAPNFEQSGTEWVFQGHLYLKTDNGTLFDQTCSLSSSVGNFLLTFQEIYFKNRPHIECLQIFHDPDDLERSFDTTRKFSLSWYLCKSIHAGKICNS